MAGAYPAQSEGPSRIRVGDFLKSEYDQRYNRDAATIKNASGTAMPAGTLTAGHPIKLVGAQWTILASGDEANCKGFFLGADHFAIPEAIPAGGVTALKYPILTTGPAQVNLDAMPLDPANVGYNLPALKTAIEALNPPIRVFRQPVAISTQVT